MAKAKVIGYSILTCRVCVPKEWTDGQAEVFANSDNPTGIQPDWIMILEEEMKDPQRVTCDDHPENVHIVMQCWGA